MAQKKENTNEMKENIEISNTNEANKAKEEERKDEQQQIRVFHEFEIPMELIRFGEHQPRNRDSLDERGSVTSLKESIKSVGLLQPVLVNEQEDGSYLLLCGERRYRACTQLGYKKIRAVLPSKRTLRSIEKEGKTLLEIALLENTQRKDLTAIEEGRTFKQLLAYLNISQAELGKRLDLKEAYISQRINFLNLPEKVQELIESNEITSSQARELLRLQEIRNKKKREEAQINIAKKINADKLTTRKTKNLVDDALGEKKKRSGEHLLKLGAKKATYFITTLNEKFEDINIADLEGEDGEKKLQELRDNLPDLIKKLQTLQKSLG